MRLAPAGRLISSWHGTKLLHIAQIDATCNTQDIGGGVLRDPNVQACCATAMASLSPLRSPVYLDCGGWSRRHIATALCDGAGTEHSDHPSRRSSPVSA